MTFMTRRQSGPVIYRNLGSQRADALQGTQLASFRSLSQPMGACSPRDLFRLRDLSGPRSNARQAHSSHPRRLVGSRPSLVLALRGAGSRLWRVRFGGRLRVPSVLYASEPPDGPRSHCRNHRGRSVLVINECRVGAGLGSGCSPRAAKDGHERPTTLADKEGGKR